jgi:hypothetical protein
LDGTDDGEFKLEKKETEIGRDLHSAFVIQFSFFAILLYALDLGFGDSLFAQIVITEKQKYRKTDRD